MSKEDKKELVKIIENKFMPLVKHMDIIFGLKWCEDLADEIIEFTQRKDK